MEICGDAGCVMRVTVLVVGFAVCAAGCGGVPTAPSTSQTQRDDPTAASSHWQISGLVTEIRTGKPIDSVLVAVTGCGTSRGVNTDSNGHYAIDAVVSASTCSGATIKTTAIGFETETNPIDLSRPVTHNFALTPTATPTADLSGAWNLTVSASKNCATTLPEAARARTYDATLIQVAVRVTVALTSPTIVVLSLPVGGSGTFIDRTLSFVIIGDTGPIVEGGIVWDYPDFVDRLSETEAVAVMGTVLGTVVGNEIRGSMKGEFEYWSGLNDLRVQGPPSAICRADDNDIILRRQN